MKKNCYIYVLLFVISLSFLFKTHLMLRDSYDNQRGAERIRSFVAAVIFKRADELMHRGSIDPENQHFKAGSYVGNTDIIPLLKLVTLIAPEESAPYQILSRSLAYAQDNVSEGVKILQRGIMNSSQPDSVHELYASVALLKMFFDKNPMSPEEKFSAIKYLNAACEKYNVNSPEISSDPAFTLENYKILIARLYVELKDSAMALKTLEEAGIALTGSNDLLFSYLADYKMSGLENMQLLSLEEVHKDKFENDTHECVDDYCCHETHENKTIPSLKYFFSALKSGLIFIALLVSGWVKKESF